jgi:PAS domain S-box-containing protein
MARADPDGRIRHVNRALEETVGRTASELIGRTLDELGPRADVGIDEAQRGELIAGTLLHYEFERRLTGPRGTTIPVLVSASLARPGNGSPTTQPDLILQLQDLRERRRAQRDREQLIRAQSARAQAEAAAERLQVMQSIAAAVLGAVGLEELLRELLDRILDALDVDRAAAVLTDDARPIAARAAVGVDTIVDREAREAVVDGVVERVALERRAVAIADVPAAGIDAHSLGGAITSLLAVPLFDGGRVIGSIQVGTLTRRDFDDETVGLLRLAADRAGLAIGRTRLYERERRIAQELQRSLLPKRLPNVAGVALGARYEPGENGTAVGGDWYDAVALPSGRVALAVGDVVGRGIEAASTMGQMRSALRAILMQADDTGRMADRLNRFTLSLGSDEAMMTTVVLAILEPGTGTLRFTNAGHPPPLLIGADGHAAYLDERPAPPMGVLATPRYKQHTARLQPGATLVLYTDGLVEEPTEVLDVGLERLRDAARGAGSDVDATCELLLQTASRDAARSDDVTLLVVRLQETLGARVTLEVSNESGGLYTLRQTLRRWLVEHGADADETEDVIMACNEACENAVEHGYGFGADLFAVEFAYDDGEITLGVRDNGAWREPQMTPDRGRGLPLMRKLMDVVDVRPRPGGTTVRMTRRLAAAPAIAGAAKRTRAGRES